MTSTAQNIIDPTRAVGSQTGGGRGGAGNVGTGEPREYVDGGLYRTGTPGADGKPYSTGIGGKHDSRTPP